MVFYFVRFSWKGSFARPRRLFVHLQPAVQNACYTILMKAAEFDENPVGVALFLVQIFSIKPWGVALLRMRKAGTNF